ncbi:PREDICTED: cytoplasmic tRNA 2-thiolation protein 1-like isoform X1 [Camelina sativa]|uniref:Cytoplasmic tRNA 2-thiolation protein 1 n=1 Tax=Camelina sativa TaxID=90675 RepID=A0ABM1QE38_CAMSA|nr:PREDICTED: cytoplasmic tRNA 2-thiolation protein 1-like isoform X1 [Camelina sativa]
MEASEAKSKRAGGSRLCCICNKRRPVLKRPKTLQQICRECFYEVFEEEIHQVIVQNRLFKSGERVAIGASGGKDSTVLAYVLSELNRRHNYGLDLFLLSIDEGITGYRDDSLETVKRNEVQYGLPLQIVSYKDLYGWTMDDIVKMIGLKNNCTFCGVFRRQVSKHSLFTQTFIIPIIFCFMISSLIDFLKALDRGATLLKVDKLVTGHNADDIAETVLLNILRGDIARLSRCTSITTGEDGPIPRCKPFKYTYEKEIVMYAYFKKLDYFSTECIYSPNAYRGFAREFIKDLERLRPRAILDIIKSGEDFRIATTTKMPEQGTCERCGYISSQKWCKACVLLEGLNRGLPKMGIGRPRGSVNGDNKHTKAGSTAKSIESKQCGSLDF